MCVPFYSWVAWLVDLLGVVNEVLFGNYSSPLFLYKNKQFEILLVLLILLFILFERIQNHASSMCVYTVICFVLNCILFILISFHFIFLLNHPWWLVHCISFVVNNSSLLLNGISIFFNAFTRFHTLTHNGNFLLIFLLLLLLCVCFSTYFTNMIESSVHILASFTIFVHFFIISLTKAQLQVLFTYKKVLNVHKK